MSQISSLAAATYAAVQGVRQGDDKIEQTKRSQSEAKDAGQTTDAYVPTVESSDAVSEIHDESPKRDPRRPKSHSRDARDDQAEEPDRLDLQA